MLQALTIILLFLPLKSFCNETWFQESLSINDNLNLVFNELSKSNKGLEIIAKFDRRAIEMGLTRSDLVIPSELSYTDSTILRSFKEYSPFEVDYTTKAKIHLNKLLPLHFAVLDLAHEMVHFLERKNFNPYLDEFNVVKFIKHTIENEGGEADAFLVECVVDHELFGQKRYLKEKCGPMKSNNFSKKHIVGEFYKLGPFYKNFIDEISHISSTDALETFKQISRDEPKFVSSVHSLPYPLAGFFEYQSIRGAACKNEVRRFKYLASSVSRLKSGESAIQSFKTSFKRRCKGFESL